MSVHACAAHEDFMSARAIHAYAGHEDEFLCTSCSAVLRTSNLHSAAALQEQQAPQLQQQGKTGPRGGGKKGEGAGGWNKGECGTGM